MRIGELAEQTGASVRSLRYYEQQGLIASHRTSGGQRMFDDVAVARVQVIRCLLRGGVPVRDIEGMLSCVHTGVSTQESVTALEAHKAELTARIDELIETRARLDQIIVDTRQLVAT